MGELLTIQYGAATASVDLDGAWLTSFRAEETDVLFPRAELALPDGSTKLRGGCHVCYPNFGPGGDSGLAQHGFGRTCEWNVTFAAANSLELELLAPEGLYTDVDTLLTYQLALDGLTMSLYLRNNRAEAVPIAPAFHPYFATSAASSTVSGQVYDHNQLSTAVFLDGAQDQLVANGRTTALRQQNLPQWVLWTDGLGDYVCLEPSAVGNGFTDGTALQLLSGETWQGSLCIGLPT